MLSLALLGLLSSGLAANPYLDEGRRLYSAVRYKQAEEKLRLATQVPTSTPAEKREAFDLLARTLAAQGRMDEGELVYAELLRMDPYVPSPEDAAPKIAALFLRAKKRIYPGQFVLLRELPSSPGQVEVAVTDPWGIVAQVTLYRWSEEESFQAQELSVDDHRARAQLNETGVGGSHTWYLEASGKGGEILASLGTAEQPRVSATESPAPRLRVPTEQPKSELAVVPPKGGEVEAPGPPRYVAWGLLALAVASAGAGTYLFVASENDYQTAGNAAFGSDTAALDRRYREGGTAARLLWGASALSGGVAGALLWRWK